MIYSFGLYDYDYEDSKMVVKDDNRKGMVYYI